MWGENGADAEKEQKCSEWNTEKIEYKVEDPHSVATPYGASWEDRSIYCSGTSMGREYEYVLPNIVEPSTSPNAVILARWEV